MQLHQILVVVFPPDSATCPCVFCEHVDNRVISLKALSQARPRPTELLSGPVWRNGRMLNRQSK